MPNFTLKPDSQFSRHFLMYLGKRTYSQYSGTRSGGYYKKRYTGPGYYQAAPTKAIALRQATGGLQYGRGYQPNNAFSASAPELKWWDHGENLTALSTAPDADNPAYYQVASLNAMAAGDDGDQRNGNKINIKKITVRIKVETDPNSDGSNANIIANAHLWRVVLYLDTSPNGSTPTFDQFFENTPNNEGQLYDYNKLANKDRFKVLKDWFIHVPPCYVVYDGTNYHSYGNSAFRKKTVTLNCPTLFSDTTNNLAAIQKNNIGMWIMCDASATTYTDMKFSYRARVRFTDY